MIWRYKSNLLKLVYFSVIVSLLLHRECCTLSNAEYVKTGLGNVEEWCGQATEEVFF